MASAEDCRLIEVKQPHRGFDHFIGSWLYRGDVNLLVDVGPARSAKGLIESLVKMDVGRVDYILLTHIHIDHAGMHAGFSYQGLHLRGDVVQAVVGQGGYGDRSLHFFAI